MPAPPLHSVIVTIHDQDLLLNYQAEGKFRNLGAPVTYMFVGKGNTDRISSLANVVIARNLADNIESHNYLVDFTSWYACIRNNVGMGRFVSMIQYDVWVSPDFSKGSLEIMRKDSNCILGYSPVRMNDRNFIRDNMGYAPLREACLSVYSIDIKPLLRTYISKSSDKSWPATNNVAMHRNTLADFVRWFTPLGLHMGNVKPAGHAFERAIKVYCILSGRTNQYAPELLKHYQMNSHKTQDFEKDQNVMHEMLARNANIPTEP